MDALSYRRWETARLLIERGASVNAICQTEGFSGDCVASCAAEAPVEIVELLVERGCTLIRKFPPPEEDDCDNEFEIWRTGREYCSLMESACLAGNLPFDRVSPGAIDTAGHSWSQHGTEPTDAGHLQGTRRHCDTASPASRRSRLAGLEWRHHSTSTSGNRFVAWQRRKLRDDGPGPLLKGC